MNLKDRLEEIEKHFETVTDEKFNENLIKAGYGVIKSSSNLKYKAKNRRCLLSRE